MDDLLFTALIDKPYEKSVETNELFRYNEAIKQLVIEAKIDLSYFDAELRRSDECEICYSKESGTSSAFAWIQQLIFDHLLLSVSKLFGDEKKNSYNINRLIKKALLEKKSLQERVDSFKNNEETRAGYCVSDMLEKYKNRIECEYKSSIEIIKFHRDKRIAHYEKNRSLSLFNDINGISINDLNELVNFALEITNYIYFCFTNCSLIYDQNHIFVIDHLNWFDGLFITTAKGIQIFNAIVQEFYTKRTTINSINEYISVIKNFHDMEGCIGLNKLFYRGQSNETYRIVPYLARKIKEDYDDSQNYVPYERNIIHRAKLEHPYIFTDSTTLDELALMQHYGLPTRLLDITDNPLVALFFACNGNPSANGEVFLFIENADLELHTSYDYNKIFSENKLCLVKAKIFSNRQRQQNGYFMWFPNDHLSGIEKDSPLIAETIIIPAESKNILLSELKMLGISMSKLFPDDVDKCCSELLSDITQNAYMA